MFNGIIFNQGKVDKVLRRKRGINLFIKSNIPIKSKDLGISVSCDGVCLTLISKKKKNLEFYLSNETLNRTKFKKIKKGDIINLELPLKRGQHISGHICQGHVDYVSRVNKIKLIDKSYLIEFSTNKDQKMNLIEKASILINGISLTISKILKSGFEVWIIPHTYKLTNLSKLKKNSLVNIEIDILSKYVIKYFNEK
jgi:riboflavin synthase|tara:strand:+ start:1132 stop:1722 length:591 start_codon:yes stop_codon:yes gene_type:complete